MLGERKKLPWIACFVSQIQPKFIFQFKKGSSKKFLWKNEKFLFRPQKRRKKNLCSKGLIPLLGNVLELTFTNYTGI